MASSIAFVLIFWVLKLEYDFLKYWYPKEVPDKQCVNTFLLNGNKDLYITSIDSIGQNKNVLKFSRDGVNFQDSVVFDVQSSGFTVLYYSDSDTLYVLTTEASKVASLGESSFKIETAFESKLNPFFTTYRYNMEDDSLWSVGDSTWFESCQPRLRPKREAQALYIRHRPRGNRAHFDYITVFFHNDSSGNLKIYPEI